MNVGELIAELQKYPTEVKVLASSDSEGNSKGEVWDVDYGLGVKYGYQWQTYPTMEFLLSDAAKKQGYTEEDFPPAGAIEVVVIYP